MAKVTTPLLSFGASGAIANTMVFFPWKGLECVRKWLIPTNPKSTKQIAQRAYLKEVLPLLHAQYVDPTNPFGAADKAAYAQAASLSSTPRTWFNTLCKNWILASRVPKTPLFYAKQLATPGSTQVTVTMQMVKKATDTFPTSGTIYYGTNKTLMLSTVSVTPITAGAVTKAVTGLTAGTVYFFQFVPIETAETPAKSGILQAIPTT